MRVSDTPPRCHQLFLKGSFFMDCIHMTGGSQRQSLHCFNWIKRGFLTLKPSFFIFDFLASEISRTRTPLPTILSVGVRNVPYFTPPLLPKIICERSTVLLVCFVCLKGSTFETTKNVFYFTSKALLVLEIIKF